jgi:hypothetical protein
MKRIITEKQLLKERRMKNFREGVIQRQDSPHYFEIKNEDGEKYCHCGTMVDVNLILDRHPTFTYEKVYLPHSPKTVNVQHTVMDPDPQLSEQKILPENQQQPLEL